MTDNLEPWLKKLHSVLNVMLAPYRMAATPKSENGRIRITVVSTGTADICTGLEIDLQPKGGPAGSQHYAETTRFHAYYQQAGADRFARGDARRRDGVMALVLRVVAGCEKLLADGDLQRLAAQAEHTSETPAQDAYPDGASFKLNEEVLDAAREAPRLEHQLRINFTCNQRCLFCFVRMSGQRVEMRVIERHLDELRARGDSKIPLVITGGEPTIDPRLCGIVEMAKDKGFTNCQIQTNAVGLADAPLTRRLETLGVRIYYVSMHSHLPACYDRITRTKNQFPSALRGIRNLLATDTCSVIFIIVINKLNYRTLPAHARFLARLAGSRRARIQIFFSQMNTDGCGRAPELVVDFGLMAPYLDRALAYCRHEGISVARFEGDCAMPACLTSDPASYVSLTPCRIDDISYGEAFSGNLAGRVKRSSCASCRYDSYCRGVPKVYASLFGLKALTPVGAAKGSSRPPASRRSSRR